MKANLCEIGQDTSVQRYESAWSINLSHQASHQAVSLEVNQSTSKFSW